MLSIFETFIAIMSNNRKFIKDIRTNRPIKTKSSSKTKTNISSRSVILESDKEYMKQNREETLEEKFQQRDVYVRI